MSADLIIGIDPGKAGGIAMLRLDGSVYSLEPMPVAGTGRIDGAELARMLRAPGVSSIAEAWVEDVHCMPADAKPAAFQFGLGLGIVHGVVATLGLRRQDVSPQRWHRTMSPAPAALTPVAASLTTAERTRKRKTETKARAAAAAARLFPTAELLATSRSRVPHGGLVDALLIAEFGRRQWIGEHGHGQMPAHAVPAPGSLERFARVGG